MNNESGHFAIIGGLVAIAMVSAGGAVAWSRANGATPANSSVTSELAVSPKMATAVRPLRDLAAIKREQIPLASLSRNPFHDAAAANKPTVETNRPQLLAAVQTLRLESVLCSDSLRSCTINGKAFAEGDTVRQFVVEKIGSSSVTLKSGLYRFELRVQQ